MEKEKEEEGGLRGMDRGRKESGRMGWRRSRERMKWIGG